MQRQMLKSKLHRARVTGCDPDYVGSLTLASELMRSADLIANEQVHVWDIDNGARFVTYAIEGDPGSRAVQVNGAAARLVSEGDKVIVASFGSYDERDLEAYAPVVVHVDDRNRIVRIDSHPEVLLGSSLASEANTNSADVLGERARPASGDEPGLPGSCAAGVVAWDEVPGSLTPSEVAR
jgi:aspartate 1-decarboxylase